MALPAAGSVPEGSGNVQFIEKTRLISWHASRALLDNRLQSVLIREFVAGPAGSARLRPLRRMPCPQPSFPIPHRIFATNRR